MKPPPRSPLPSPNTVVMPIAGVLPDERAGLGHRALAGIELDLEELQFLALDLEIDIVGDAGVAADGPRGWGSAWQAPA